MMRTVIVSGFFNPLHVGHLDMIEAAAELGDRVVVIVNSDTQQIRKKGRVILHEYDRLRVVNALKSVDRAIIATDSDDSVSETLRDLAYEYKDDHLVFANGGDRKGENDIREVDVCRQLGIEMYFGAGGNEKSDSSTRINKELGREA